jgi:hypothetical protein
VGAAEVNTKPRIKEASRCRQPIHVKQEANQSRRKKLQTSMQCVRKGNNRISPCVQGPCRADGSTHGPKLQPISTWAAHSKVHCGLEAAPACRFNQERQPQLRQWQQSAGRPQLAANGLWLMKMMTCMVTVAARSTRAWRWDHGGDLGFALMNVMARMISGEDDGILKGWGDEQRVGHPKDEGLATAATAGSWVRSSRERAQQKKMT